MQRTKGFLLLIGVLLSSLSMAQAVVVPAAGTGLRGQYYAGRDFDKLVLTRLDKNIDFDWSYGPPTPGRPSERFVSPGPGVPGELFSVRWTGYLYAPVSGTYTLHLTTDDGMRVWLGQRVVLNEWRDQRVSSFSARVRLTAGRYYPLQVEYYQVHFDTRALLAWQTPPSTAPSAWNKLLAAVGLGEAEPAPVPTRYLYPALPASAHPTPTPLPLATALPVSAVAAAPAVSRATPATKTRHTKPAVRRPNPRPLVTLRPQAIPADTVALPPTLPTLRTLVKGETLTLPNLYFTRSTAAILPTSYLTLNALARTLEQQPALRLTIAGHTDNIGDAHLNQRLSEQRAYVVRRYLVQQGIDSLRLSAVGYGGTHPVADNRDPRQRPRNRRVEVVVE